MLIQDIYKGLEVESFTPTAIERIYLTARIIDPLHFVFIPETWEAQLKPFSKAKWKHNKIPAYGACLYEIKEGAFLVFPQFNMTNGGFYAAHLYAVVKNMPSDQAQGTLTVEGLTIERLNEGKVYQRVTLKPRGLSVKDTPYQVILK